MRVSNYTEEKRIIDELRIQLQEANDIIDAIRTGQVDALVVQHGEDHRLYTLQTADMGYRVLIEKMTEGAVTVNSEGIILYCNSTFACMAKHPLSKVIGSKFIDYVPANIKEDLNEQLKKNINRSCKTEISLLQGKKELYVQLSLTPLQTGDLETLSIIVTDLTALKKSQDELETKVQELARSNSALEQSNHDLQQFASVASHDLQEPLRKIQIFSGLLADKDNENLSEDSKSYLSKIISSAGRMKMLVVDMLDYSKLSSEHQQYSSVELNGVVAEVLEDLEMIIQDKNANITVDELATVHGNRGQMRQVFQNILSNAIKFCKAGDEPVIHVSQKRISRPVWNGKEDNNGSYALIKVSDNGIGFDQQYADNIFGLFERLNSKDKYEGTGIGLAITKKIIEKHNGYITARSRENKGSDFLIILPVLN